MCLLVLTFLLHSKCIPFPQQDMRENIGLGGLAWYELSTGRLSQQMGHSSVSTKLDTSKKLEWVDKEDISLWSLVTRWRYGK